MPTVPTLTLNDGHSMPQLGLGVWQVSDTEATPTVAAAFEAGYRAVDTAAMYGNEAGVGAAVKASPFGRDAVFVTTKLGNPDHGYDQALRALDKSLGKLGFPDVDLYLIHWPQPGQDRFVETWRALIKARQDGRARSIGVSNFTSAHLTRLKDETGVVPSVNQVELHPRFQQRELRAFHARHGIATESWSPLGRGAVLDDPAIDGIARKHGKTPAQVVIRWHLDNGLIVIPKSATPSRIVENIDVFDFALDAEEQARIEAMDTTAGRRGPNPAGFN